MNDADILVMLKIDLQISTIQRDAYLCNLIKLAKAAIEEEGITLKTTVEDGMLVEMYAAYLYRKRRESDKAMPRSLRYGLNNRLLSQKGSSA